MSKFELYKEFISMLFYDLLSLPFGEWKKNRKESKVIFKLLKAISKK